MPGRDAAGARDHIDSLVSIVPITGCWLWMGTLNNDRYGVISARGGSVAAHRVSYEVFVGPIPEGLQLDHLCRNRWCVNPAHLEPVTAAENMRRSRATHCREGHPLPPAVTGVERHCDECRALRRAAQAARPRPVRTECVRGHQYTPENTYWQHSDGRSHRSCLTCRREVHDRRKRERLQESRQQLGAAILIAIFLVCALFGGCEHPVRSSERFDVQMLDAGSWPHGGACYLLTDKKTGATYVVRQGGTVTPLDPAAAPAESR